MAVVSRNPFLNRQQEAPKNAHGKRSEERLAKSLGMRLTPASGAVAGLKGDMRTQQGIKVLLEAKSTTATTMPIDLAWLIKIKGEALGKRSIPAVSISFVLPDGKPRGNASEWVMLPKTEYEDLLEKANDSMAAK
jgi:hypothetical protein